MQESYLHNFGGATNNAADVKTIMLTYPLPCRFDSVSLQPFLGPFPPHCCSCEQQGQAPSLSS